MKPLGSDILQIAEMLIGVREPPFVAWSIKRAEGNPTVGYITTAAASPPAVTRVTSSPYSRSRIVKPTPCIGQPFGLPQSPQHRDYHGRFPRLPIRSPPLMYK